MKAPCLLLVRSCSWDNKAPLFPLALPTGWAFPAARGADQQLADSHHWLPSILSITWRWVLRRRGPKSDGQMDRKMCLSIFLACLLAFLFFPFSFFLSLFFLFFFFSFLPQKLTSNTHCSVTCSFYFMIYLGICFKFSNHRPSFFSTAVYYSITWANHNLFGQSHMASHLVWLQFLLQTILYIVFSYVQENLEEKLLVNGYFSGYKKDTSIWSPQQCRGRSTSYSFTTPTCYPHLGTVPSLLCSFPVSQFRM